MIGREQEDFNASIFSKRLTGSERGGGPSDMPSTISLRAIYGSNLNVIWVVQSPLSKIFRFPRRANHFYQLAPSHPRTGADRESSRTRGGMRWTRQRWACDELVRRRTAQMRTAKSCGPGIRC